MVYDDYVSNSNMLKYISYSQIYKHFDKKSEKSRSICQCKNGECNCILTNPFEMQDIAENFRKKFILIRD